VSIDNFGRAPKASSEPRRRTTSTKPLITEEPASIRRSRKHQQPVIGLGADRDTTVVPRSAASSATDTIHGPRIIPGEPITVTLNKGDVFQLIPTFNLNGSSDLTGSLVTSTKRVAVFSGHNCAYVPDMSVKACNLLAEQIPPTSSWGRTFALGALEGRSQYVVRVVAREDSTIVTLDGRTVATLSAGEYHTEVNMRANALLLTSRPALVAQYSPGFDNGDDLGDPMMIVVPPVEQFDNVYTIATPVRGPWRHYVNIVVKTDELEELQVDGHPVDQTRFKAVGESGLSVGCIEISYGPHIVTGARPFGLYQYGFGYDEAAYDAYGNSGGQLYIDLDSVKDETATGEEKPDIGSLYRQ
jgi:adhesin/invasin